MLEPNGYEKTGTMKVRFPDAQSVEMWLQEVGRNKRWLALQLDWNPSKVSRLLNGNTKWNRDFSRLIEPLEARFASH